MMVKKVLTILSIIIFIILCVEVVILRLKPTSEQLSSTYGSPVKAEASEK